MGNKFVWNFIEFSVILWVNMKVLLLDIGSLCYEKCKIGVRLVRNSYLIEWFVF